MSVDPFPAAALRRGTDTVRVGIIENHEAVVVGLRSIFVATGDLLLVAHTASVDEFVAASPDVHAVLLDLRLTNADHLTGAVSALSASGARVLAYADDDVADPDGAATDAGLSGVVRMCEPVAVLVAMLRCAVRGPGAPSSDLTDDGADTIGMPGVLTARELQVLAAYASGEKADRVARQLGIARETVLDHVRRIRIKYRERGRPAPTKVDLYRRAVEDGLLPHP